MTTAKIKEHLSKKELSENQIGEVLQKIKTSKPVIAEKVWNHSAPISAQGERDVVLNSETIQNRVKLLALKIVTKYPKGNIVLISLMLGGLPFAALLVKELENLNYAFTYEVIQTTRYKNQLHAGDASLEIHMNLKNPIGLKDVLVVDDVCDHGLTYFGVRKRLEQEFPNSVALAALVNKAKQKVDIHYPEIQYIPEFSVFELPADAYIVGMGLDFYGQLRNKAEIRVVNEEYLLDPEIADALDLFDLEADLYEEWYRLKRMMVLEVEHFSERDTRNPKMSQCEGTLFHLKKTTTPINETPPSLQIS